MRSQRTHAPRGGACALAIFLALATSPRAAAPGGAPATPAKPAADLSGLLRVNVALQAYNFHLPWSKKNPEQRRGIGALLEGGRVLVTASMVANHTYVEVESAEPGRKTEATVEVIDHEANLALLRPADASILQGLVPFRVGDGVRVDDPVSVLQLEPSGRPLVSPGRITTIQVIAYPPLAAAGFLAYRVNAPLEYRDGSHTMPVVRDGRLVGMLMTYSAQAQTAELASAPVIAHFLKDAADGRYDGFPRAGFSFSALHDPQLRRHVDIDRASGGGIYVTEVTPRSAARAAGLREGDVVLTIAGHEIDREGNYQDATYGKLGLAHLFSTLNAVGDTVPVCVWRQGERIDLGFVVGHPAAEDSVIPPYSIGEAPRYLILGGLIFTELSRQYLREYGDAWQRRAPTDLVYRDLYQIPLYGERRRKIVLLAGVLPAADTVGYEDLKSLVVRRVNGVEIVGLQSLAEAVARPVDGMHRVEFESDPREIVLDAASVSRGEARFQRLYGLPSLRRL